MANPTLAAAARDLKQAAKKLRQQKMVPAVFYGNGKTNESIVLDHETFRKVFAEAGSNTIIDLKMPSGATEKVLVHDVQRDPVMDTFMHVDFYGVKMTEKLTTEIPFEFVGESNAVKNLGGMLTTNMDEIEVRCLPGDLVHSIVIDLSKLENLNDSIHLSDITMPHGLEVMTEEEDPVIVSVQAIEEEKEEESTGEVAMPEVLNQSAEEPAADAAKAE